MNWRASSGKRKYFEYFLGLCPRRKRDGGDPLLANREWQRSDFLNFSDY
jgi:hypothetical protein